MLARDLLREEFDRVGKQLAVRGFDTAELERWRSADEERRSKLVEVEELKRQRNEASKEIGRLKGQGEDAAEQIDLGLSPE